MKMLSMETELYSSEIKIIEQTDGCIVYKMETGSGEGIMTSHQVFPGIELIYNDFHMGSCFENKRSSSDIMEINHCRQGRFECEFSDGAYVYLENGDLAVNMLSNRTINACFPLEHYHGVSVLIRLEGAAETISSVMGNISIDLYALRDKLCGANKCFIMRAKNSIEHIFSELYTIPDEIKQGYFKLKVLELLFFLSISDVSEQREERQYFSKKKVETIKKIKQYMIEHLDEHVTLVELSTHFDIPLTTMKLCFKGVYGTSIYAYMRSCRMQSAALMLRESKNKITAVAGKVGYQNSGKFAAAFKDVMQMTPREYQKAFSLNGVIPTDWRRNAPEKR